MSARNIVTVARSLGIIIAALCMVLATADARGQEPSWKWPRGNFAVCWDNLVPDNHDDYRKQETRREWVEQAVTRNWAAFSNGLSAVAFTG